MGVFLKYLIIFAKICNMCGIVCALDIKKDSKDLRPQILDMSKKLRHRGPDWNGIFSNDNAILAHERLAIVDPKSGKQPLYGVNGRYVLAANGEIYNHKELRKLVPDYNFLTESDCEVIIALYDNFGVEFVDKMKPGSVIVDLAAEKGGNCDLTKPGDKIVTKNNVTIVGYTDFPSRMASQSSTLYATNIRHMIDDLTPKKDGKININMKDDVIRGSTVTHNGEITFPPPPPKVQAIAKQAPKPVEKTPEDIKAEEVEAFRKNTIQQTILLCIGGLFMFVIGNYAPSEFMQHMIVFALACFVGFQVIWNVSHALHTPLMAVTNAISGIIIIGAVLQMTSESWIAIILAAISVLISTINIVGGFLVTRRMLAMFQKS